jgi:leucyl aminopeptidase
MASTVTSTVVRLFTGAPADTDTDLLVVPMFDAESFADALPAIDSATAGEVKRATASGEIKGRLYEFFVTPASGGAWKPGRVAIAGAGKAADFTTERLRKVAAAAALMARGRRIARVAFMVRGPIPPREAVQAIAEGLILAGFSVDLYKTGERFGPAATDLTIVVPAETAGQTPALEAAVRRGQILGDSSNLARAFANEPSNILTPSVFAERAAAISKEAGVAVQILDEKEIARLGMGLLLGVARGSSEPPRVIVMRHDPPGAPKAPFRSSRPTAWNA